MPPQKRCKFTSTKEGNLKGPVVSDELVLDMPMLKEFMLWQGIPITFSWSVNMCCIHICIVVGDDKSPNFRYDSKGDMHPYVHMCCLL